MLGGIGLLALLSMPIGTEIDGVDFKLSEVNKYNSMSFSSVPTDIDKPTTIEVGDDSIVCSSIVQGAKENDLPDGNYTFSVVRK